MENRKMEIAGLVLMALSATVNWWVVPYFTGKHYLIWYLNAGPFVALAIAAISVTWGELEKDDGLVSSNPLEYSGAYLQVASLPLLAIGGHARRENQPNGLSLLDSLSYLLVMFIVASAILAWLWLIVPLQYFVLLVCGAPARAARRSNYVLYARIVNRKLETKDCKLTDEAPDGYWNASMREKPLALSNSIGAGVLFIIGGFVS